MKTSKIFLETILILFVTIFESVTISSSIPEYLKDNSLTGKWLGEIEIPGAAKLRMGIIVSGTGAESYKAMLNIIDQATGDIPCDTIFCRNDSVIIRISGLGIKITGSIDSDFNILKCEFRQGGGILPVDFNRVNELPVLARPQVPGKPYPYREEFVVFNNENAGIKLAGTLTYPASGGKFPAVILVTGSGQQDRDETIGGHKPFWILADYLTRNGVAVLRYDDRGSGGSTGDFSRSTTGDFSEDVLSAITFLKKRPEINQHKIGIAGHSEGGTVAALTASKSVDVSFIISMAGAFVNFEEVVLNQILAQQEQMGRNAADLDLERKWRIGIYSLAKENTDSATAAKKLWDLYGSLTEDEIKRLNWPRGRHEAQIKQVLSQWWRYALGMDNKAILMKVNCPVLALYGDLDKQIDPDENILVIETGLKSHVNQDLTVKRFPGLNHLFQTAGTGSEYEYIRIEETISPVVLKVISDWILQHTI